MSTSDLIKSFLEKAADFGGKGWRRLSKKSLPKAGAVVREFRDKATGQGVRVIEIKNVNDFKVIDGTLFVFSETKPKAAVAARKPFETLTETDPDRNAAAERAMDLFLEDQYENEEEVDALLQQSGPVAWANRFLFAYSGEDEGWYITPVRYFEQEGYAYDGSILFEAGLDDFEQSREAFFTYWGPEKPLHEVADHLMRQGYVFHPAFQQAVDPKYAHLLSPGSKPITAPEPSGNG